MRLAVFAAVLSFVCLGTAEAAPLEAYGQLPTLDQVTLSPDGSKLAYVSMDTKGTRYLVVQPATGGNAISVVKTGDAKIRDLRWVDESNLIILSSVTTHARDVMGPRQEYFLALVLDLANKRQFNLMEAVESGHAMNVVYDTPVVRMVNGKPLVFVQGVYFTTEQGRLALFSFDPASRRVKLVDAHSDSARDWFIDANGTVVADEEYNDHSTHWALRLHQGNDWKEIYGEDIAIDMPSVEGFSSDGRTLIVSYDNGGKHNQKAFATTDGAGTSPVDKGTGTPMHDRLSGRIVGYVYEGREIEYEFIDPKEQAAWKSIVARFPREQVDLISVSDNRQKVIVKVTGINSGVSYFLVDVPSLQMGRLGPAYNGIEASDISDVGLVNYQASDGRPIFAYLTLPHGRGDSKLPLIVMPHGGPAARDDAGFDWWAQALASMGYAVLQPQYRGTDGFGWDLLSAGFGQWGRKMQTDLSDGVRALVRQGLVDPARVCIVGGSYGGYAALAGATIDTGVYRCAASYGGLSDLHDFIDWKTNRSSNGHLLDRYWARYMGTTGADDPALAAISPIKHIDKITIPVLLIHGKDDTVVPIDQSEDMANAMRRAGKNVTFVELDGEDHWLSRTATRQAMLKAIADFLKTNNPP
jgi:dipeptidyl aminopeptidase/acylaminoacyl peptidase